MSKKLIEVHQGTYKTSAKYRRLNEKIGYIAKSYEQYQQMNFLIAVAQCMHDFS